MEIVIFILMAILLVGIDYFIVTKARSKALKCTPLVISFVSCIVCSIILYFTHSLEDGLILFYIAAYSTLIVLTSVIFLLFFVKRRRITRRG